ncbi:MAG: glycosyltransferase family 4 protein [Chloroflexi bacterium]|nr:glycosyltransferase family 4 protein [Chloroflexota bacterium]
MPSLWRLNDDTLPLSLARPLSHIPRRIVAVSGFLAGRYQSLAAPMTVIPDGVPLLGEAARPETAHRAVSTITHAARLVRWKGQAVFIRAMADVARRVPEAHGEIVGVWSEADNRPGMLAGGEPYHRELLALAESLRLGKSLTFDGFRERSELFANSTLTVHSSLLPEPFGRTILEAMAAGLPVIGTRAGAVPEIIVNGVTGRLVPAGDAPALAEAIVALLRDSERRRAMGEAGRARARDHFSVEEMARRFEQAWLEAIG